MFRQSLLLLSRSKKVIFISVVFLTIGFVTIGSIYIVGNRFFQSSLSLKNKVTITVFFKTTDSYDDVVKTLNEIRAIDGVKNVLLITKEEGEQNFLKLFPQYASLLKTLNENPFPYTAKVEISDISMGDSIKNLISSFPTVDLVIFSRDVAKKINNLTKMAWLLFVFVFLVVVAEFVFISQSVMSFLVDLRHTEIKVLKLVGADNLFIEVPFILVIVFTVFISWGLSVFLLKKIDVWSVGVIKELLPFADYNFSLNTVKLFGGLFVFGLVICLIGGIIPLKKVSRV